MENVTIRAATEADLARLTEIYNYYIINTPITFDLEPFSVEERQGWFYEHGSSGPHRLLVADVEGVVVGYVTSSLFRPKAAYQTSVETSIYLTQETKSQGIGTKLYFALFDILASEDVHRAYAGITLPNEASSAVHKKFGFQSVGIYHAVGRKFDTYWDVEWFEKRL